MTGAGSTDATLLPPEDVEGLQLELLRATVERVAARHPFYRRRFGGDVPRISSLRDLPALGITTKRDVSAQPEEFRLEPDEDDPTGIVWDIAYTSGSTSRPTPLYQTVHDFRGIMLAQRRMSEIRGITSADCIANLYPLTQHPHGAWIRANHGALVTGATVFAGMGGAPIGGFDINRGLGEILGLLRTHPVTVLWGVPSYLRRVLGVAVEEGLRLPGLRMLAVSGEPCGPALRDGLRALAERVGGREVVVSDSLGASELQCGLVGCTESSGFHNPSPEQFLFECVDEDGVPVPDGEQGRLTLTHLDRTGTVLLRYSLGDEVRYTREPCDACGRTGGRVLEHMGRHGTMTKIRGNLLDTEVLLAAVADFPGVEEHQVVIVPADPEDPRSVERLVVRVAGEGVDADGLADSVRSAVRIRPEIERLPGIELFDGVSTMKPKRLVDQRQS